MKDRSGFVYFAQDGAGRYKIGMARDPEQRIRQLDIHADPLTLVHVIASDDAAWLEKVFHRAYSKRRIRGEWFRLTQSDLDAICQVKEYNRPNLPKLHRKKRPKLKKNPAVRGGIPTEERLDIRVNPIVRQRVIEHAEADGLTLNEAATIALCGYFGLDPANYRVPRKPPGRPFKRPRGRPRKSG